MKYPSYPGQRRQTRESHVPDDLLSMDLNDEKLAGYLGEDLPNPLMLLPPPPEQGSPEWEWDRKFSEAYMQMDDER